MNTGCPCGCETVPGLVDDPNCARHRARITKRGVSMTADHLAAAGLLDDVTREILRRQWTDAT